MVDLLINAGNSVDTAFRIGIEDPEITPPLHMAIDAGRMDVLKGLLAHKPDLETSRHFFADGVASCRANGKTDAVEMLLQAG